MKPLTFSDLVRGLDYFPNRYEQFSVFEDDLETDLTEDIGRYYQVWEAGVCRIRRDPTGRIEIPALVGDHMRTSATSSAMHAAGCSGPVLGLLSGLRCEDGTVDWTRIFCLEFRNKEWVAYDGGLVRWMKENLL